MPPRTTPHKDGLRATDITNQHSDLPVSADYGSKVQTSLLLFAGLTTLYNVFSSDFQQVGQHVVVSILGGNCEWGALLC